MIRFLIVQNTQGVTRLSRWYVSYSDDEKQKILEDFYNLVNVREIDSTNFIEYHTYKIVYRRYAGLYFGACVDSTDNELAALEAVHLFVEVLDTYFGSVCELDIVFNFWRCYSAMDELFLAGEIQETNKTLVIERLIALDAQP